MQQHLDRTSGEVAMEDDVIDIDVEFIHYLGGVKVGPPWYDEITGQEISDALVKAGMEKERASRAALKVSRPATYEEAKRVGGRIIGMRWVLRLKDQKTCKARLVLQEVNTGKWQDTYAAAPTPLGQRLLIWRGLTSSACFWILDVSTAFLHAPIPQGELIFGRPPVTEKCEPGQPGELEFMLKAQYGLRMAPKWWQDYFVESCGRHGWRRLATDPQLFVHENGAWMSVHTDDILLMATEVQGPELIKTLETEFSIKPGKRLTHEWTRWLGREWRVHHQGLDIRIPTDYMSEVMSMFGMRNSKAVETPMVPRTSKGDEADPALGATQHEEYRRAVGKLMWMIGDRPDLSYAVKEVSRYSSKPCMSHLVMLKRILRYLQRSRDWFLRLEIDEGAPDSLQGVTDSSWADTSDRKSTTGGALFLQGFGLGHWSRGQPTIALSSCEAELAAATTGAQEALHAVNILAEAGIHKPIELYIDATSTQNMLVKRGPGRMRHLEAKSLWLQEAVQAKKIIVRHISSEDNIADLFTKPLMKARFDKLVSRFGMWSESDIAVVEEQQPDEDLDIGIAIMCFLIVVGGIETARRCYRSQRWIRQQTLRIFGYGVVREADFVDPKFGSRAQPSKMMTRLKHR
jgi:histone deacetylase 1/2